MWRRMPFRTRWARVTPNTRSAPSGLCHSFIEMAPNFYVAGTRALSRHARLIASFRTPNGFRRGVMRSAKPSRRWLPFPLVVAVFDLVASAIDALLAFDYIALLITAGS